MQDSQFRPWCRIQFWHIDLFQVEVIISFCVKLFSPISSSHFSVQLHYVKSNHSILVGSCEMFYIISYIVINVQDVQFIIIPHYYNLIGCSPMNATYSWTEVRGGESCETWWERGERRDLLICWVIHEKVKEDERLSDWCATVFPNLTELREKTGSKHCQYVTVAVI